MKSIRYGWNAARGARLLCWQLDFARAHLATFSHLMKPDWHAVPTPLKRASKQNCNLW